MQEKPPSSPRRMEIKNLTMDRAIALQRMDVVEAHLVDGFHGFDVVATMERHPKRRANGEGPGTRNQDMAFAEPTAGLIGVCDGVGSTSNADDASALAAITLPKEYLACVDLTPANDLPNALERLLREQKERRPIAMAADRALHATEIENRCAPLFLDPKMARRAIALVEAVKQTSEAVKSMNGQTTLCTAVLYSDSSGARFALVANIGDSAAFIRKRRGKLLRITEEDSLIRDEIDQLHLSLSDLQEMRRHPQEERFVVLATTGRPKKTLSYYELRPFITRMLGIGAGVPSLSIVQLDEGDELLCCTDGVTDKFEKSIDDLAAEEPNIEHLDLRLMGHAAVRSGTFVGRVSKLRSTASSTINPYKAFDDSAIVGAHAPFKAIPPQT